MYFPYNFDPIKMAQINANYPATSIEQSVIAATIPFGFGIKVSVGERLGVGAEFQMRKLLNDKFDDLDDPLSFETINSAGDTETIKYTDFLHNNDWPGYLGIHVTYKINLDTRACPAYDRKHW